MKKRMYYNMRIKTISRNSSSTLKLLKIGKKLKTFKVDIDMTKLSKRFNTVLREIEERQLLPLQVDMDLFQKCIKFGPENKENNPLDELDTEKLMSDLDRKKTVIQGRIHSKNEDLKDLEVIYQGLRKKVFDLSEQNIHRMMTELETGGNIRFEEGKPTDRWYSSCVDLIRSRFNPEHMKEFGVIGINVIRVTRIHNRFLRNRFEERLEHLVDLSDTSYKRSLEYLFYGVDPSEPSEIFKAMEEGFRSQNEYKMMGMPPCVGLVNSIASAEGSRINNFFNGDYGGAYLREATKGMKGKINEEQQFTKGMIQIPSGQVLVCKVFLSKCVQDIKNIPFNPKKSPTEIWTQSPVDLSQYQGAHSVYRAKENDPKQRIWFILDNALVLPEYLVEFEYITSLKEASETKKLRDNEGVNSECNKLFNALTQSQKILKNTYITHSSSLKNKDSAFHIASNDLDRSDMGSLKKTLIRFLKQCGIDILADNDYQFPQSNAQNSSDYLDNQLPPDVPTRSKIEQITIDAIKWLGKELNFKNVAYLNLFNNKIQKVENFEELSNLQTLIISFNEISKIEGLSDCISLKKLDLNHNFIMKVEGIEGLENLKTLDLSNNWISTFDELELIAKKNKKLIDLSLKCNPISAKKAYRKSVFQRVMSIQRLDSVSLSDKDKALFKVDTTTLNLKLLKQCAKFQLTNTGGDLLSANQYISDSKYPQSSYASTSHFDDDASSTASNSYRRGKSNGLQQDEEDIQAGWEKSVEVLSINHKGISKIASLEPFVSLRRLSFIDNSITKIEGLGRLKLLEELSFEKNKITLIEGISHLQYLKKLDLGRNRIKVIEGINKLENLTQLSLEDNEISTLTGGVSDLANLMELYIGNNLLKNLKEIMHLKPLQKLIILDLSGNVICKEQYYRVYCAFHLKKKLKVLDGVSFEAQELTEANEMFAGRLTEEILDSRINGRSLQIVKELDLSSCKLRDFDDMFDESIFPNLKELNISHNQLVTLRGFGYCPKLKVLQVTQNKLETLFCKPTEDGYPKGLLGLPGLEVLDVSFNNLHELYGLQFAPLKELKILSVSNNDIQKIDFLQNLINLREIDLTKNRVKQLDPTSFSGQTMVSYLRMEENPLKTLAYFEKLERIKTLYLTGNRIAEIQEIDRLIDLQYLVEISLQNNPLARKPMYRASIIKKLPNVQIIDSKEISLEERERIEVAIMQGANVGDPKPHPMIHYAQYPTQMVPVKMNSVNFDGVFNNLKSFQDQPSPSGANQKTNGSSIPTAASSSSGKIDMGGLIQINGYTGAQENHGINTGFSDIINNGAHGQAISGLTGTSKANGQKSDPPHHGHQRSVQRRPSSKSNLGVIDSNRSVSENKQFHPMISGQKPPSNSGAKKPPFPSAKLKRQ